MTADRPAQGSDQLPEGASAFQRPPERGGADRVDEAGWYRRGLAEFVGTFALTFVAAGGAVIAVVSHGAVSPAARAVAPGLMVGALIYSIGDVSGAHFNPAV